MLIISHAKWKRVYEPFSGNKIEIDGKKWRHSSWEHEMSRPKASVDGNFFGSNPYELFPLSINKFTRFLFYADKE